MKKKLFIVLLIILIGFLGWRFVRPMNIFLVDDRFAWPVDTSDTPELLIDLSAEQCALCHQDFYDEWRTSIHSQAWTDPYFQTDWQFEGRQHSCRLCHTPLDRQQPEKVLSYRDSDKWDPVLEHNPDFEPGLQHEGVTCAACHYRGGKILGVLGVENSPHQVQKLEDPNLICVRCHIVEGERWDTFFRLPPCGTVAEIERTLLDEKELAENNKSSKGKSGEFSVVKVSDLSCVECHMPLLERSLVTNGVVRHTRQHLWRGGHDPEMVKKALTVTFSEVDENLFRLTISNTGAAHYVPTGTPDRFLSVHLRSFDRQGRVIDKQEHTLKRTVMWRPFIVDLWDTRLPRWQTRKFDLQIPDDSTAVKVEAVIKYHLLDEKRRKRINYKNNTPINYEIFHKKILLQPNLN